MNTFESKSEKLKNTGKFGKIAGEFNLKMKNLRNPESKLDFEYKKFEQFSDEKFENSKIRISEI